MNADETPKDAAVPFDPERLIVALTLVIYLVVVLRCAWITDDAYITLRTVDNFVHGEGLRWNTFERVQSYTHPLWMFVLAIFTFITREGFLTPILVGVVTSMAAALLLARRVMPTPILAAFGVGVLLLSRSFVDFSTSGLENPLLHLLLVAFAALVFAADQPRRPLALVLVAAACLLTRLDAALLVGPALALVLWQAGPRRALRALALGLLPLVAWELFSLVYYGFLFPNTAYAKLGHGIGTRALLEQGLVYFFAQLSHDPLSLTVIFSAIFAAIFVPILRRERTLLALALGLALYEFYVLWIGGDFMAGRFFSAPLIVAVMILGRAGRAVPRPILATFAAAAVVLGLAVDPTTLKSDGEFGQGRDNLIDRGVADERAFYYPHTGLLRLVRGARMPIHPWLSAAHEIIAAPEKVWVMMGIGMIGHRVGPEPRLIDIYGLADPLLARLPAVAGASWRIGHFRRHVPAGYVDSLESGEDRFVDRDLAEYNRQLRLITAAPIFSGERWAAIWRMNTGQLAPLIDVRFYRRPVYPALPAQVLGEIKENGYDWEAYGIYRVDPSRGLLVQLSGVEHLPRLDVSLTHRAEYTFEILRDGEVLTSLPVSAKELKEGGLRRMTISVPEPAARRGYDAIRILSPASSIRNAIGHLIAVAPKSDEKDKDKDKPRPAARRPAAPAPAATNASAESAIDGETTTP